MLTSAIVLIVSVNTPDLPRVAKSIAVQESSNKNCKPYWDVNGYAWGLYAFHAARWKDCGGKTSEWGKATPDRQLAVMTNGLRKQTKKMPIGLSVDDKVRWYASWHNGRPKGNWHTAYADKVLKIYKKLP